MPRKTGVTRFSVSLPPVLVKKLDEAWKSMKYENRSKAIHDAVRSFITEFEWMHQETGEIVGAVIVLYYLDKPGLLEEIARTQHEFTHVISSTLHVHLDERKCMELISVRGTVEEVRNFAETLMAKKGVKQVKVAAMTP